MDIYGFNKGWDASGEGDLSPLASLAKRLSNEYEYGAAFRTYQKLDVLEQQQVRNMCDNQVLDKIDIDTYKTGF